MRPMLRIMILLLMPSLAQAAPAYEFLHNGGKLVSKAHPIEYYALTRTTMLTLGTNPCPVAHPEGTKVSGWMVGVAASRQTYRMGPTLCWRPIAGGKVFVVNLKSHAFFMDWQSNFSEINTANK